MLLSVIIPVYNKPQSIRCCVDSFLTVGDISQQVEIIVVDDGSEQFTDVDGCRIIHTEHRGAAAARNEGIAVANGRFVWFFDADDKLYSNSVFDLLQILDQLPDDADMFHTGPMIQVTTHGMKLPKKSIRLSTTRMVPVSELFVPKTAYLDHTTYIVSRRLLHENEQLRYPQMSILEDSLFVLRLLETTRNVYVNETICPYLRMTYLQSSTAGAWNKERCERFLPDIRVFFDYFGSFINRHTEITDSVACYRRMRYVYLRVLAVKGCTWSDICSFMDVVGRVRCYLLLFYRFFAFLCRTFRSKK